MFSSMQIIMWWFLRKGVVSSSVTQRSSISLCLFLARTMKLKICFPLLKMIGQMIILGNDFYFIYSLFAASSSGKGNGLVTIFVFLLFLTMCGYITLYLPSTSPPHTLSSCRFTCYLKISLFTLFLIWSIKHISNILIISFTSGNYEYYNFVELMYLQL